MPPISYSFDSVFKGLHLPNDHCVKGKSDGLGVVWDLLLYPTGRGSANHGFCSFYMSIPENSGAKARVCFKAQTAGLTDIVVDLDKASPSIQRVMDREYLMRHFTKDNTITVSTVITGSKDNLPAVQYFPENIRDAYLKGIATDFNICVAGKAFPVHKLILTISSSVFKSMFESGMIESTSNQLTIDDFTPEAVKLFLDLIYGVDHEFSDIGQELRPETLRLCDKYDTRSGASRLTQELMSSLTVSNCLEMFVETDSVSIFAQLRDNTLKFIQNNFMKVLALHKGTLVDKLEGPHLRSILDYVA